MRKKLFFKGWGGVGGVGFLLQKKILMEGARPFQVGRVQEFLRGRGDVSKGVGGLKIFMETL